MGPGRPQPRALLPQRRVGGDTGGAERCWSPGSSRFSKLGTVVAFQGTGRFPPAPPWCLLPEELTVPSKVKVKFPILGGRTPAGPTQAVSLGAAGRAQTPPRHCWGWAGPWKETNCSPEVSGRKKKTQLLRLAQILLWRLALVLRELLGVVSAPLSAFMCKGQRRHH